MAERKWFVATAVVVAAVAAVVAAVLGVAVAQNRAARVEREVVEATPPVEPLRLEVAAAVAQVLLVPGAAGTALVIEADFDPEQYALTHTTDAATPGPGVVHRVTLRPIGAEAWAVLRMKMGGAPARLKIAVPADAIVDLNARGDRGVLAAELGGTRVRTAALAMEQGAMTVSFREPTATPMERLAMRGRTSSLEVTGLGNASPREATFQQRLGAVDLDLRGAWARDGVVRVDTGVAGGTVWLPEDVEVRGVDATGPAVRGGETPLPVVVLELPESRRSLVLIR